MLPFKKIILNCFFIGVSANLAQAQFSKTGGSAPAAPPPTGSITVATKPAAAPPATATPQPKPAAAKPQKDLYQKEYEERIRKTELNGVYIPKDLFDAMDQLDKLIDEPSRAKFKQVSEEEAVRRLYFSLGRWIWVNWSLLDGSRLSEYFREYGLHHGEDIATLIIRSYHRKLNGKDIDFKGQIAVLKEKYEAEKDRLHARSKATLEKQTGKKVIIKDK
jgi:hypothetical protein